jgi:hypothetical protein
MFDMFKDIIKKFFFMDEEEYQQTLQYYAAKFQLQQKWIVEVVEKLPQVKTNYSDPEGVKAFTDWVSHRVVFKHSLMLNPKWITRAYIRHELRHCQQMELIHLKMKERYGELAGIYTQLLIAADNIKGYNKSLMEQDAWLVFFGVRRNINKTVDMIIKRNMRFVTQEC